MNILNSKATPRTITDECLILFDAVIVVVVVVHSYHLVPIMIINSTLVSTFPLQTTSHKLKSQLRQSLESKADLLHTSLSICNIKHEI